MDAEMVFPAHARGERSHVRELAARGDLEDARPRLVDIADQLHTLAERRASAGRLDEAARLRAVAMRMDALARADDSVRASVDRVLAGEQLSTGEVVEVLEKLEHELGGEGVSLGELAELLLDGRGAMLELVRLELERGGEGLVEDPTRSVAGFIGMGRPSDLLDEAPEYVGFRDGGVALE